MARIRVTNGWLGQRSNFRFIEAGEYDGSDERLFGLGGYLVRNGHAVRLDDPGPVEPTPDALVESIDIAFNEPVVQLDAEAAVEGESEAETDAEATTGDADAPTRRRKK